MPYIGTNPTNRFSSVEYQDLTGVSGSPAKRGFTLNNPVGSANDIEVFVNNVRQEPSVAYTVDGTTTLTMTGDVETTDDFYVVFQGKAIGTATHPAGASLQAASGTFSSGVTIDGNLGVGTTAPAVNLEVEATSTNGLVRIGQLQFKNSSGSHVAGTDGVHIFPFTDGNIYHDNFDGGDIWRYGTSSTEAMRLTSSGHLFLGTQTSFDGNIYQLEINQVTNRGILLHTTGTSTNYAMIFQNDNGSVGSISTNGSATTFAQSSDYRLKENVTDLTGATNRLKQLNPVRFNFIADADTTVDGFLAHEVQAIVPEAVIGTKDATENYKDENGNEQTRIVPQGIDQSKLVPLLVATIQELEARIAALEAE